MVFYYRFAKLTLLFVKLHSPLLCYLADSRGYLARKHYQQELEKKRKEKRVKSAIKIQAGNTCLCHILGENDDFLNKVTHFWTCGESWEMKLRLNSLFELIFENWLQRVWLGFLFCSQRYVLSLWGNVICACVVWDTRVRPQSKQVNDYYGLLKACSDEVLH